MLWYVIPYVLVCGTRMLLCYQTPYCGQCNPTAQGYHRRYATKVSFPLNSAKTPRFQCSFMQSAVSMSGTPPQCQFSEAANLQLSCHFLLNFHHLFRQLSAL